MNKFLKCHRILQSISCKTFPMPLTPLYQGPVYRQYSFGMVSVLADILVLPMREMSYGYQYRLIRKLRSLGFIGIGRYEKKLIGCTRLRAKAFFIKECYFNSSIQTQAIYKFFKNIAIKFLPHFAKNLTLPTLFFTSIYAMMTVAK